MTRRKIEKAFKRLTHLPGGSGLLQYSFNKAKAASLKISKSTQVAHPSTIMLEVTNKCNLKCITCPREHGFGKEMDKGFMPFEQLTKVVDQCYPYIDSIGLTGLGETMLYPQLADAVRYIKSKSTGIITSISTNASMHQCIEKVEEMKGLIDTVQISIDGIGEVYDSIRINGDFKYFISNVQEIAKVTKGSGTHLTLNMVIVKENYQQMSDLVELAHETGIHFLNFTLYNLASDTKNDISYYDFFTTPEFIAALKKAHETATKYPNLEFTVWDHTTPAGFRKCHFPWTHFYITWDGWLVPCCAKPFPKEMNFGNVFETSLMECLNSKPYQEFRDMWFRNETPDFCKKCHFIALNSFSLPNN